MTTRTLPRFYGPAGLARFLGVSDTRVRQIKPAPDALLDGRPVWSQETANRLKRERDARASARIRPQEALI
jgi:hypothetical protein